MGYPELVGPDGRPVRIRVRKHLALLIYLAVEGRSRVSRDVLVELLWGAAPAADGRHSLSTGLSLLRAVLGRDVIESTATSVRFDRAAVGLDLDRLTSSAEADGTGTGLEEDSFLADFSIPDSPPFAHWRDGQQARLFPLIRASLVGRLDLARRSGDVAALASLGERLSRLDPLAEEAIRARMEALAMSGDRMSALRLYEEWKAELETELRARPSESLESIAQRLRRSGTGSPATVAIAVRGESWSQRPFVGRAAEFRQVFEAWESTLQLRSQHVVIEGETGLGKSTLAQRFADAAGLQGAACARVQCFELEQRVPFGMMGSLVSTLLDRPGAVGTDPAALAEIGRLVSKVRARFPELPPPRPVEGEAARVLFAEGVFALLEAIAEEQPVVLVIDDYPRSDEASLSVLHMLLRRTELGRVMVILTARLPESGEPAQAVRIRKGIASLALRRMVLSPLDESSSDAVLTALVAGSSRRLHPPERRAILRAAAGNPLALELLAQDWITHGDAAVALTLPAMQAEVPSTALSVTAYDRVVDRLVPNLSRRARRALWLATILGPRLNEFPYFELVGLREGPLVAALSELTCSLVLRDVSGRLEFTNELMRARLYLLIPSGIRTKLHGDVSTRLIAADAEGREVPGLEIAWHCIRARQSEQATSYLMRGARHAIAAGAPDEASRALSTAMKHLKGRDRDEGTLLLAETLQEMGDWGASLEVLAEIALKRSIAAELAEIREVLTLNARRGLSYYPPEERERVALQVIEQLPQLRSSEAFARSALLAAQLVAEIRDVRLCRALRLALDANHDDTLSPRLRAMRDLAAAMSAAYAGDRQYSLRTLSRTVSELESHKLADTTTASLYIGIGAVAASQGDYPAGLEATGKALPIADRLDNAQLAAIAIGNLGVMHFRVGDYNKASEYGMAAYNRARGLRGSDYDMIRGAYFAGMGHGLRGESCAAAEALRLLTDATQHAELPWVRQQGFLYMADLSWITGCSKEALKAVKHANSIATSPLTPATTGLMARWKALSAVRASNVRTELEELLFQVGEQPYLDALDLAEIDCAILLLESLLGCASEERAEQLRKRLAELPAAVSQQLFRLGILPTSCGPQALPEAALRPQRRSRFRARH